MNPFLAEFIGTFVLILMGCGVNASVSLSKTFSSQSGWLVIAMGWGFAVVLGVYASASFSGAHINPAVTIGLAAGGAFPWADVPGYVIAQLGGAFLGATLVWIHYMPHWRATEDQATKLGVFATSPAIPTKYGAMVSEIIGTFVLLFAIMFIGVNEFASGLNPLVIGSLVVAIGLSLGGTSGYAINPARDLGPRLAHAIMPIYGKGTSNWKYAPIPVVGPIIGGVWGVSAYQFLFESESFFVFAISTLIVTAFFILSIFEGLKK
jgi:glycerol uptake facilitator protein